jgi:adenine-specific DNA-methyltransferase
MELQIDRKEANFTTAAEDKTDKQSSQDIQTRPKRSDTSNNSIGLESRRYIGSKAKLAKWIIEIIKTQSKNSSIFADIFAGTGSISKIALNHFKTVIINDTLHSNNVIYKAFFSPGLKDDRKIVSMLNEYNHVDPNEIDDNYFSLNFGGKFFDYDSAKILGYIREDIESRRNELTDKEYNILLATLIYNMDKIANTVGHFDAYIKKPIKPKTLNLRHIETSEIPNIKIYQEDANLLARKIEADIAYVDPPYNSRQYNRFYHIYETLVKWDKPQLFGIALKPVAENSSVYCTVKAKDAFRDLVENLRVKYLAVSYNNTYNSKSSSSENKIKLEEIQAILEARGKTKVFECSHKYFNTGKTEFDDHKELLFLTKING